MSCKTILIPIEQHDLMNSVENRNLRNVFSENSKSQSDRERWEILVESKKNLSGGGRENSKEIEKNSVS
jgi:hypothetical protein